MEQHKTGAVHRIYYRRTFPWVHAFRAFGIAARPRALLVAGLALLVVMLGDRLIDELPFSETTNPFRPLLNSPFEDRPLLENSRIDGIPYRPGPAAGGARDSDELQARIFGWMRWTWQTVPRQLAAPFVNMAGPAVRLLRSDNSWSQLAEAWTRVLWRLAVLAVFAALLTRLAAVRFARDESAGLAPTLRFVLRRWLSYFTAPLLPFAGIGILAALCMVAGFLARIPGAGTTLVGIFWIVPLALAFFMALLTIGTFLGWPLMYAAISTEGSDGFDGLSRSFNYVCNRPWHFAWNTLALSAYGTIVTAFVLLFVHLVVWFAEWGVRIGLGPETPALTESVPVRFWLSVANLGVLAFVFNYFWTSATVNFFLLRLTDDGTPLHEIYVPDSDAGKGDGGEPIPLVGTAASAQPVIERPANSDAESTAPSHPDET